MTASGRPPVKSSGLQVSAPRLLVSQVVGPPGSWAWRALWTWRALPRSWAWRALVLTQVVGAVTAGAMVAYLIVGGSTPSVSSPIRGVVAAGVLLVTPAAFVVVHRYPLSAVLVWLAFTPFLQENAAGTSGRMMYWALHRGLPPAVLIMIGLGVLLRVNPRRVPRPGWPELLMLGYLVASYLSVAYLSDAPTATAYHLYDRVFVPMCLYLIVRLQDPDEDDLRRMLPVMLFLLLAQTLIGLVSWAAPGALPGAWLNREGLRTTGSLIHPNVYGSTMIIAGALLLHFGMSDSRSWLRRWLLGGLFLVALAMVFMTYTRASWIAALVVTLGLFFMYPRFMAKLGAVAIVLAVVLVTSGLVDRQIEAAQARFLSERSEDSALSRLPVIYASFRMFESRPVAGFGYGNFDRFDREYQSRVGNLVAPDKDHASHNLYLTLLAEQGLTGFVLYTGPAVLWLLASLSTFRRIPPDGLAGRRLLVVLWLALASQLVVNNFSNMRIVFGLGLWWLILGMIGALVHRHGIQRRDIPAGDPDALTL
jgi:hypothetical protein